MLRRVEVVVVDVQLRIRVCGACGFEGDADVGFAERVVEGVGLERAVFVEDLVYDVLDL